MSSSTRFTDCGRHVTTIRTSYGLTIALVSRSLGTFIDAAHDAACVTFSGISRFSTPRS